MQTLEKTLKCSLFWRGKLIILAPQAICWSSESGETRSNKSSSLSPNKDETDIEVWASLVPVLERKLSGYENNYILNLLITPGRLLNDSHAEVLARRLFLKYVSKVLNFSFNLEIKYLILK